MRISAIFTSFNNNSNSYYKNKDNSSVKFSARKDLIVLNRANVAKVKPEAQAAIKNITENIGKLKEFFKYFKENISTNPNILTDFRKKYKNFSPKSGQGYQFKLKEWFMNVSILDEHSNMLKIYTRKDKEEEPHLFYIEQDGSVRANAYPTQPRKLPKGNIFMNDEQIYNSNVEYQILIADREISNFLECMENSLRKKNKDSQTGVLKDELQSKVWDIEQNLSKLKDCSFISAEKGMCNTTFLYRKHKYPNITLATTHGESFKFGDEIVSINRVKTRNLTKIVVRDLDKKPTKLFYIDDGKYLVSNANIDFLAQIPAKLKNMNQKEIDKSGIDKYLDFLSIELKNYREYVEKDVLKIEPTVIEEFKPAQKEPELLVKPKAKRGPKPKQKEVNRLPAKIEEIAHTVPKKGDLLPEFDGIKRREYPNVLKLSEIDEIFEEITGQTINEACGTRGNAPIPQPESFKKNVVIKHIEEPKKVETQSKEIVKTVAIKKEVSKPTKNPKIVEPSIWGLAKYLDEKESFSIKVADGGNIDVALKEIEGVEYISLVKTSFDKKKKYFNIDCDSEKLLKTDLTRKPMIKDDNVIPYSDSDLKALGLKDDLEKVLDELFTALNGGEKTKALQPKIKMLQTEEKEIEKSIDVALDEVKDRAKLDAKEYAEVYFDTFVEEFKNTITKKLEEFEKNKSEFLKKFIK